MKNKKSIVFFARDFLATEFSKISHDFSDFTRIYITVNKNEIEKASKFDVDGIYIDFQSFSIPNVYAPIQSDVSFNLDRYLRFYDTSEILTIANRLRSICEHLISNYDIAFYVDEPVSGYINSFFNNFFHSNGVQCLHFQTSWIPGYMFFVSDAAQHSPVKIDMLGSTEVVVGQHVERRKSGLARPLYVIDYSGYKKRISDLLTTTAKAVYRKIFRSTYLYIDKDPSAHFLHAHCLLKSFVTNYDDLKSFSENERYVVYPLHYEPEAVLNYFSPYNRQEEIANQILDTLPAGFKLVLKEHPSQPGALGLPKWQSLIKSERVISLPGGFPSQALFNFQCCVVSIGSTMALEAAVAGRPVGVLGDVHFAGMPGITKLETPRDWGKIIASQAADLSEIKTWYSNFMSSYCFEGNIMRNNSDLSGLRGVINSTMA